MGISYEYSAGNAVDLIDREKISLMLDNISKTGLSFSKLYNFISCPYRFLLEGIYKIEKWEDESGDIAQNTMGSVFHKAIELLTVPFLGKVLVKQDFDTMSAAAESCIETSFQNLKVAHTASGYNYLVKDILLDALVHWLRRMKDSLPADYYVKDVEHLLQPDITLRNGRTVRLKGVVDRVEFCDGVMRVMDFKTTHQRYKFVFDESSDADLVAQMTKPDNRYMTQVLFYSWLYSLQENVESITGGVYPVLNSSGHRPDLLKNSDNELLILDQRQLSDIGDVFSDFIEQIFESEQIFQAKPSDKNCQYCPYNGVICNANTIGNPEDES